MDKNIEKMGAFELEAWEQWFDEKNLTDLMKVYCSEVRVIQNVEGVDDYMRSVFNAWIGLRNESRGRIENGEI